MRKSSEKKTALLIALPLAIAVFVSLLVSFLIYICRRWKRFRINSFKGQKESCYTNNAEQSKNATEKISLLSRKSFLSINKNPTKPVAPAVPINQYALLKTFDNNHEYSSIQLDFNRVTNDCEQANYQSIDINNKSASNIYYGVLPWRKNSQPSGEYCPVNSNYSVLKKDWEDSNKYELMKPQENSLEESIYEAI